MENPAFFFKVTAKYVRKDVFAHVVYDDVRPFESFHFVDRGKNDPIIVLWS